MKGTKTRAPRRARTETMVEEFARLAAELARLAPERFAKFSERMFAAENAKQKRTVAVVRISRTK